MREFVDEMAVLSGWLGRDVAGDLSGVFPAWTVFRFRDAVAFESEVSDGAPRMYLVRGDAVREFVVSQVSIDEAYAELSDGAPLPAAA